MEKPRVKRTHKDVLFRMLFEGKKELLSLYNAVNGTDYQNEEDLIIVTLKDAVYMNMKNDVAFVLGSSLNLYEHQSTVNPNMPLRDLLYIAKEYSKLTESMNLYSKTLQKIPTPRFVVFYNGTDEQPEVSILRLSDAFLKEVEQPELELTVTMLNINLGKNRKLMEQCETLKGYAMLIEKIRRYAKEEVLENAVEQAVDECIKEHILETFLREHRAEVVEMSIFSYDEEKTMRMIRQEEYEDGLEEGKRNGIKQILGNMITNLNMTIQQAIEAAGIPEEERAEYEELLKNR